MERGAGKAPRFPFRPPVRFYGSCSLFAQDVPKEFFRNLLGRERYVIVTLAQVFHVTFVAVETSVCT
jgi:hypothetical protein